MNSRGFTAVVLVCGLFVVSGCGGSDPSETQSSGTAIFTVTEKNEATPKESYEFTVTSTTGDYSRSLTVAIGKQKQW